MTEDSSSEPLDRTLTLPNGAVVDGAGPVIIIGPNGSGKTRQARRISANCPIEFVNALRNTRIPAQLPALSYSQAESQFVSTREQGRATHWEWTNEIDLLLSSLLAELSVHAIDYMDASKSGQEPPRTESAMERIRSLWSRAFPGRDLVVRDAALQINTATGASYSASTMSDGERTAVYLAGRVFRAQSGVIVVDEPEHHLHTNLASRLWDELEEARPDLRFVYITHDLGFARSRRGGKYVVASKEQELEVLELHTDLPDELAEALLGVASVSFHAKRAVFCEGERQGRDHQFYEAWFDSECVVQPVGPSEIVHRCLSALGTSHIIGNLVALGIIDRDYHTEEYIASLPPGMFCLPVHEVESLYCLSEVVGAVARHTRAPFDASVYLRALRASVTQAEEQKTVTERWKRRVEPQLISVIAGVVPGSDDSLLAAVFDPASWSFDPTAMFSEEVRRVRAAVSTADTAGLLAVVPGKGRVRVAAQACGLDVSGYLRIVNQGLSGIDEVRVLGEQLTEVLSAVLPPRGG